MQCPSCGHQNRSDSRFCVRCGTPLAQRGQAVNLPPQTPLGTQMTGPGGPGWQSPPQGTPSPAPLSAPPIQSRGHGGIVGIARNVQQSSEQAGYMGGRQSGYQQTTQILRFRLEQYDQSNNRTVRNVELRSLSIEGFITEGDRVEVFGKSEGGLIRAKQIVSLDTGAVVEAKGFSGAMKASFVISGIVGVMILALVGSIFFSVLVLHQVPLGLGGAGITSTPTASPDSVLNTYCSDLGSGAYQWAYDQYSTRLKSEVSSAQLSQMWSGKFIDSCTHASAQVSGKQAMTTLSITAKILANQSPPPEQTYTYHVVLVQDGSNGWKIDSLQSQ